MPRSVNAVASRRRRKKILKAARGYFGARSKVYTVAKNAVEKAMQYAYIGRKLKKRAFRRLWIARINAAARQEGMSYSTFMHGLSKAD
ncbi:MAG: 50S ribosomal protein L20, partial [Saprospiraceae bacterium]